jgi:hypothetical protein
LSQEYIYSINTLHKGDSDDDDNNNNNNNNNNRKKELTYNQNRVQQKHNQQKNL